MNVASAFAGMTKDEIKALLDGGTLTFYSVARPINANLPVNRSAVLFAPHLRHAGFRRGRRRIRDACLRHHPVPAAHTGTPGFARACKADGTVVADFSVSRRARDQSSEKCPARPALQ